MTSPGKALRLSFCALVALLAVFQFSENTADPDLWGHVVFGREILRSHAIPKTEPYSWTARGQPWINHEWLAEIALGGAHEMLGGGGLLLLKMAVGLLTFALCLRMGGAGLEWPARYVVWICAALAAVEISYGFAARPQIFTALGLILELMLLRRIHDGARLWALALPVLFVVWINTHGGALVGFALLVLTAMATTAQTLRRKMDGGTVWTLWLAAGASLAALFCNPWGTGLLRWLVGSILWLRPEIGEWNPTPVGWDHAAFFLLVAVGIVAWFRTGRPRAWWELAVWIALVALGFRAVRNAPLFCIAALALTPHHLADGLARYRNAFPALDTTGPPNPSAQEFASIVCCLGAVGAGLATFTLHKEHPLTMEAPRTQYPISAVNFLREKQLHGRLLVFFDWGELAIFELPDCPPSIDGRLDTCYSRDLIAAHWKFYNDEPSDQKVLNPDEADLALLPRNIAGMAALARRPGWRAIYSDDLAVILARNPERFPALRLLKLPIGNPSSATQGRASFPDNSPRWGSG